MVLRTNRNIMASISKKTLSRLLQASFHKALVCGTDFQDNVSSTTTKFFPQTYILWNDYQDDASSTTTKLLSTSWYIVQPILEVNASPITTCIFPSTATLWHRVTRQCFLDFYNLLSTNRYFVKLTPKKSLPRLLQNSFHKLLRCGTDSQDDASSTTTNFLQITVKLWDRLPR